MIKRKQIRAMIAFGDVTGSSAWNRRIGNTHREQELFYATVYHLGQMHSVRTDNYVKPLGDGLMIVRELRDGHNCVVAMNFLMDMGRLCLNVREHIPTMNYPRPTGFRCRFVCAEVTRIEMVHPFSSGIKVDYVGPAVDLTSRLLSVSRDIPCLCHESMKDILKKADVKRLNFERFTHRGHRPRGIDSEDLNNLWTFTLNKEDQHGKRKQW
jgi:class 3 adenylate cyclase